MDPEVLHTLWLGTLIGAIPTVSMMLMSLFVFNVEVSKPFEAMAQNLCAGLIIGAVGKELFPQLGNFSDMDDLFGLSIGFVCGFLLINYQESLEVVFEQLFGGCFSDGAQPKDKARSPKKAEQQALVGHGHGGIDQKNYRSVDSDDGNASGPDSEAELDNDTDVIEHPILLLGSQIISSPTERKRIREKVTELLHSIQQMQDQAAVLFTPTPSLSSAKAEILADQIDEEIHRLHYHLDHCRRLLQGSGSEVEGVVPRIWITSRGKAALHKGLAELHDGASRISGYLNQQDLSRTALIAMHDTMGSMDDQLSRLHNTVENYTLKWGRRLKKRVIPIPSSGSYIPLDLLIPVVVDCMVDGFLLGTTVSFSGRAGLILGAANCIEMGFLGMAVSVRIQKCTASSLLSRYMALIIPPLIMLATAVFGSYAGSVSQAYPVAYVSFISFGMVALLYLALNELLAEAREAVKGEERWYTGLVVFGGIYIVMIMDIFLP